MKHVKMLGLAAIAALGLMAFVGAGTASATTLCTSTKVVEGKTVCAVAYGVGQEIHSTLEAGTSAELLDTSGGLIATCTESTTKGSIEGSNTGTWVGGKISTLTWGGCSQPTKTLAAGSLEIMQTSGDAGEVVGKASEVTLSVFGVSCVYGTKEGTTLGTITGGEAPKLAIAATLPKVSGGFLCPSTGVWHAHYIVTTPHALHIVS
jgi:hypothetical protein